MRIPVGPEPVPQQTGADLIPRMEVLSAAMPLGAIAGAQFADPEFRTRLDVAHRAVRLARPEARRAG